VYCILLHLSTLIYVELRNMHSVSESTWADYASLGREALNFYEILIGKRRKLMLYEI
jgi:hypothetical protein